MRATRQVGDGLGQAAVAVRAALGRRVPIVVVATVWLAAALVFPSQQPDVVAVGPAAASAAGAATGAGQGSAADTFELAGPATEAGAAGGAGRAATGPVDAATAAAIAASAATGAPGVSRGGVECGPGVRQVPTSTYAAPCIPAYNGPNGGATARGVDERTVRIVRRGFPSSANSQAIAAVAEQAGAASAEDQRRTRDAFLTHFDKMFELYGRKIEWVDYTSRYGNGTAEAQGKGREEACLDADVVAKELRAFAVIAGGTTSGAPGPVSKVFAECAAQRGVLVLDGAAYASNQFYESYHPYIWSVAMDCERIVYQVVEYIAKRLANKPARWAGNEATRAKQRTFGVYTPASDGDSTCGDLTQSELRRYGLGGISGSVYNYTLDVSRFPDEAARGVRQFKNDGVTSLVLACDPISVIFLTQQAQNQNWHPEWLIIGVALTDVDNLGRLYDQGQVDGSMFGLSQLGATPKLIGPASEPGRLYQQLTGREIPAGTTGGYFQWLYYYSAIQAAGPNLTVEAVARGLRSLPPGGAPLYPVGKFSFQDGPDGAKGAGDHTAIDDSREVYWDATVRSPADGGRGAFVETYGGRRFTNGEWPAENPPIYPGRR